MRHPDPAASDALFAYGTLIFEAVLRRVLGGPASAEPARLAGYLRLRVRGASYPGLRRSEGAVTEGVLWRGLSPAAIRRLDDYEGALYDRRLETVTGRDGPGRAWVYVVPESGWGQLSDEAWEPERFRREGLASFVASLRDEPAADG